MGHFGLTPQAISALGGFCPQGQSSLSAITIIFDHVLAPSCQWAASINFKTYYLWCLWNIRFLRVHLLCKNLVVLVWFLSAFHLQLQHLLRLLLAFQQLALEQGHIAVGRLFLPLFTLTTFSHNWFLWSKWTVVILLCYYLLLHLLFDYRIQG